MIRAVGVPSSNHDFGFSTYLGTPHAIKHLEKKYEFIAGIVVQKKSTNPETGPPKVESRASPVIFPRTG
jgi:hypothetical protein